MTISKSLLDNIKKASEKIFEDVSPGMRGILQESYMHNMVPFYTKVEEILSNFESNATVLVGKNEFIVSVLKALLSASITEQMNILSDIQSHALRALFTESSIEILKITSEVAETSQRDIENLLTIKGLDRNLEEN